MPVLPNFPLTSSNATSPNSTSPNAMSPNASLLGNNAQHNQSNLAASVNTGLLGVRNVTSEPQDWLRVDRPARSTVVSINKLLAHYSSRESASAATPAQSASSRVFRQGDNKNNPRGAARLRRELVQAATSVPTPASTTQEALSNDDKWHDINYSRKCGTIFKANSNGAKKCSYFTKQYQESYREKKITAAGLLKTPGALPECEKQVLNVVPENQCNKPEQLSQHAGKYTGTRKDCVIRNEHIDTTKQYGMRQIRERNGIKDKNGFYYEKGSNMDDKEKSIVKSVCPERNNLQYPPVEYCKSEVKKNAELKIEALTLYREVKQTFSQIRLPLCKNTATGNFQAPVLLASNFTRPDCTCEEQNISSSKTKDEKSLEEKNLQAIKDYCKNVKQKLKDWLVDSAGPDSWETTSEKIKKKGNGVFNNFTITPKKYSKEGQEQIATQLALRLCQMAVERLPQDGPIHRKRLVHLLEKEGFNRTDFLLLREQGFSRSVPNISLLCDFSSALKTESLAIPSFYHCKRDAKGECKLSTQSLKDNPCTLNTYGKTLLDTEFWKWLENQSEKTVVLTGLVMSTSMVLSLFTIAWGIAGLFYCYRDSDYKKMLNTDTAARNLAETTNITDRENQERENREEQSRLFYRMNEVSITPGREAQINPMAAMGFEAPAETDTEELTQSAINLSSQAEGKIEAGAEIGSETDLEEGLFSPTQQVPFNAYLGWAPPWIYTPHDEIIHRTQEPISSGAAPTLDSKELLVAKEKAKEIQRSINKLLVIAGLANSEECDVSAGYLLEHLYKIETECNLIGEYIAEIQASLDLQNVESIRKDLEKQKKKENDLRDKAKQIQMEMANFQNEEFYTENIRLQFEKKACQAEIAQYYIAEQTLKINAIFDEALRQLEQKKMGVLAEIEALKFEQNCFDLAVHKWIARLEHHVFIFSQAERDINTKKTHALNEINMKAAAELERERQANLGRTGVAAVTLISLPDRHKLLKAKQVAILLKAQVCKSEMKKIEMQQEEKEDQAKELELEAFDLLRVKAKEKADKKTEPPDQAALKPSKNKQKNILLDLSMHTKKLPESLKIPFEDQIKEYLAGKPLLPDPVKLLFVEKLVEYVNSSLHQQTNMQSGELELSKEDENKLNAFQLMVDFLNESDLAEKALEKLTGYFIANLKQETATKLGPIQAAPLGRKHKKHTLCKSTIDELNTAADKLPKHLRPVFLKEIMMFLVNFERLTKKQALEFTTGVIAFILQSAADKSVELEEETDIDDIKNQKQKLISQPTITLEDLIDVLSSSIAAGNITKPATAASTSKDQKAEELFSEEEKSQLMQQAQQESETLLNSLMPELQQNIEEELNKALLLGLECDANEILQSDEMSKGFSWLPTLLVAARSGENSSVDIDEKVMYLVDKMLKLLSKTWKDRLYNKLLNATKIALKATPDLSQLMHRDKGKHQRMRIISKLSLIVGDELNKHVLLDSQKVNNPASHVIKEGKLQLPPNRILMDNMAKTLTHQAAREAAKIKVKENAGSLEPQKSFNLMQLRDERGRSLKLLRFETGKVAARERKVTEALNLHKAELVVKKEELYALQGKIGIFSTNKVPLLAISDGDEKSDSSPEEIVFSVPYKSTNK